MKIALVGPGFLSSDVARAMTQEFNGPMIVVPDDTKEEDDYEMVDEIPQHLMKKQFTHIPDLYMEESKYLISSLGGKSGSVVYPSPKFHNGKPLIPKGHKKFVIEGVEIYALNYKNALKKFNKI
jgi:hypothetical protein